MSKKDDKKLNLSPEEISREEKKRLRREAIKEQDTLAIDETIKKPGMRYRLCNVTPGNIERYRSMGYEVVQTPIHVGTNSLAEAKSAKGSVEVTVGKTSDLKAVWMETSEENYQILREIEAEKAKAQDDMVFESEIPSENRIGDITKDFLK